jgi:uncharacterized protein (DUF1499 family)
MRIVILLISIFALVMAGVVFVSGPGVRLGWWDYGAGLGFIRKAATPLIGEGGPALATAPLFAATLLSLVGFVLSLIRVRGLALLAGLSFVVAAGASFVPIKMKGLADSNPYIHDITTDFEDPPAIVAAAEASRKNPAAYAGAEPAPQRKGETGPAMTTADAQRKAFPDIQPLRLEVDREIAVGAARVALKKMGMTTLAEGADDSGAYVIEAVATSFWYGFKDDFIVRIRPMDEGGVRVDARSKSRVGVSDLGANAARIRDFMKRVQAGADASH